MRRSSGFKSRQQEYCQDVFVLIPYKTDAAIDHRPWGTLGLIAANLAVAALLGFAWTEGGEERWIDALVLSYGTITPWTWITSAFVHAGIFHLGVNLVFLWTFGLVVEGAVGWRRFLPIYLAIVASQSALEQLLMLGADVGGSCGASAGVSGLMAIAAIWAPRNYLTVFVWIFVLIRRSEITVLGFCVLWLGLDLLGLFLGGFEMSSELLHLMGGVAGLAIGIWMLKNKLVDREGWDYFSLREHGRPRRGLVRPAAHHADSTTVEPRDPKVEALVNVRDALESGDAADADDSYERAQRREPAWILPRDDLCQLIDTLLARDQRERAIARLEEYLQTYAEDSTEMRLTLASALVQVGRPSQSLEQLASLSEESLSAEHRTRKARMEAEARAARDRGGLELE